MRQVCRGLGVARTGAVFALVLGALVALAAFAATRPAAASARFGLQLGGTATVLYDDAVRAMDEDADFAVGLSGDFGLTGALGLYVGGLFGFDPETMHADLLLGLRLLLPIEQDQIWLTLRAGPLVKYFFDYDAAGDGGLGVGGSVGPGLEFAVYEGDNAFTFDMDVQVWKFLYPSSFADADTQVGLTFLFGWKI
jgi:hypothetical protein